MNRQAALDQLNHLMKKMEESELQHSQRLKEVHPERREDALNLLLYLTIRKEDILDLQHYLATQGYSGLRFAESDPMGNVDCVIKRLQCSPDDCHVGYDRARSIINQNTFDLFKQEGQLPLIMVTLSAKRFESEKDYIPSLLKAGMRIARINCGHDNAFTWMAMADELERHSKDLGITCSKYFDLSGPKLRIQTIQSRDGRQKKRAQLNKGGFVIMADYSAKEGEWGPATYWMKPALEDLVFYLKVGQELHFDDGIARGMVVEKTEGLAMVKVNFVETELVRLKVDAGINVPELASEFPALTVEDQRNVELLKDTADVFGLSFVNQVQDITELRNLLKEVAPEAGIMIKLETPAAFLHFPDILFELMKHKSSGVMIARGDLGLSMGFDRLSEVQEEVLWICEAARIPVTWATQVLEKMVKKGLPSRPEITDAAMSVRAEAVMLNKGDHQQEALEFLRTILVRMQGHYVKKRLLMRPLKLASRFFEEKGLVRY